MTERRRQFIVFTVAVALRWAVALALFAAMGNDGLFGTDSRGYYGWISDYVAQISRGEVGGWEWFGPNVSLLPLPSWLWAINGLAFGDLAALTSVLCQGAMDGVTCVLIYRIAQHIDPRFAFPAGLMAAGNPTQIVMADLYYTDSIFLCFATLLLFGANGWLRRPSWQSALLVGVGAGGALLSRVLIAPWIVFLVAYLGVISILRRSLQRVHVTQLTFALLIALLCSSPIVARNHAEAGAWTLTTQAGAHSAFWVVPLVMQAKDGTPWEKGVAEMRRRVESRFGPDTDDAAENSRRHSLVAAEAMAELGAVAVVKAWLYGAAINLGAPIGTVFPPLAQLPRTGFFATSGSSLPEKVINFLFHSDSAAFAWSTLIGILGVIAYRLLQLRGMTIALVRQPQLPTVLLLLGWAAFILLVNGPVASPKYRLPIEPVLMVLAAIGYVSLRRSPDPERGRE
ncbi:MAG: glycosyltransferase family 39 protein [Rhodocyclales bacterium]|nr:glycosyltransferase family 39 protein [Rhodocyclales bacterium]